MFTECTQNCSTIDWNCINMYYHQLDLWIYTRLNAIQSTVINDSPVFILGHPRTGTTLLHGLLALDDDEFIYCSTFCAGFPSSFLWFERFGKRCFAGVIDETRPMDNVKLDFDLPQEDELAVNVMSGGMSPYMPLFFMRQELEYRPYFTFEEAGESANVAAALRHWKKSFMYLLKKLTLRSNLGQSHDASAAKRLVLKSPVHTARIPLILSLFPKAQFVYIHRNPYDVFRSAAHMADTTYWFTYLNTPSNEMIQEFILKQYEILWTSYESARLSLPPEQLIEVSYDDLSANPTETVGRIYKHFGWPGWHEKIKGVIEREAKPVLGYQRNVHKPLSSGLAEVVDERWRDSFVRLGYKMGNGD